MDTTTDTTTPTDPRTATLLVRGATVLTCDDDLGDLPTGDVLVRGSLIEAVGPDLSAHPAVGAGTTVLDGSGTIAVPGFVDAHVHAWEGALRGVAPVVDFGGYLGLTACGAGPRTTPEDVEVGTLVTALVALDAGTTTVVDNAHDCLTPDHARASATAWRRAGVRAVVAVGSPFGADLPHVPGTALALRDELRGDPLLSVRLFEVDPTEQRWAFAREHGLWVSTELGPHTPDLDARLERLAAAGLFTAEHALNHCYDLSERAWDLVAASGAAVNLCPRSDAAFGLGSGVPPVVPALRRGVRFGLSGDNEISYPLSAFADMQALAVRDRAERARRSACEGGGGHHPVPELTPADLLRAATLGGARNAGLADVVGSLTPGKQADLVLVRRDGLATALVDDPAAVVTSFAGPAQVDTVVVAGQLRKRHGRLLTPGAADLAEVLAGARGSRRRLLAPAAVAVGGV